MTDEIYLSFMDGGTSITDVGNIGEVRIDGASFTVYGDEAMSLQSGKWKVTNGSAIGNSGLTNQEFDSVILGQAK